MDNNEQAIANAIKLLVDNGYLVSKAVCQETVVPTFTGYGFSPRVLNVLHSAKIFKASQLTESNYADIRTLPNMNVSGLSEICGFMETYGLKFNDED